jgi:lysophospholipase L1-like esterase
MCRRVTLTKNNLFSGYMRHQFAAIARRHSYVGMVNVLVFVMLFSLAEVSYRVHRDGVQLAILKLKMHLLDVPYSNLGTGNWVIYDEELGYRLNPNKRAGINNLSVRHGDIVSPKPEGLYRIVVLGDSIPWAEPGFVNYLEEMLSKERDVEVINAGVPGYTAYQELLFFKRYLQQTEPDLVIWTYCLNDNHKFLHRFDERAKMLWTDEALESLKTSSLLDKLVSRSYILSELKLRILGAQKQQQVCRFRWECVPDFNIAWKDEPWAQYEAYLDEMKRLTQQMHSELAIVVFPYEPQLEEFDSVQDTEYVVKPQRKISSLCQKYDVPCLDLIPDFQKKKGDLIKLFRDGIHLTKEGHQLTAGLISTFLHDKDFLLPVRRLR